MSVIQPADFSIDTNRQPSFVRELHAEGARREQEEESENMNADRIAGSFPAIAEAWTALQDQVPLTPVRSEKGYETLKQFAKDLTAHLQGDAPAPLADLLEIATMLIAAWEAKQTGQLPLPDAAPRDVLRYLLQTHKLRQKDLSDIASPTVISDILAGRRAISKNVAKALAVRFHTDVSRFL